MRADSFLSRLIGALGFKNVGVGSFQAAPYTAIYEYLRLRGYPVRSVGQIRYHAHIHGVPTRLSTEKALKLLIKAEGKKIRQRNAG